MFVWGLMAAGIIGAWIGSMFAADNYIKGYWEACERENAHLIATGAQGPLRECQK